MVQSSLSISVHKNSIPFSTMTQKASSPLGLWSNLSIVDKSNASARLINDHLNCHDRSSGSSLPPRQQHSATPLVPRRELLAGRDAYARWRNMAVGGCCPTTIAEDPGQATHPSYCKKFFPPGLSSFCLRCILELLLDSPSATCSIHRVFLHTNNDNDIVAPDSLIPSMHNTCTPHPQTAALCNRLSLYIMQTPCPENRPPPCMLMHLTIQTKN